MFIVKYEIEEMFTELTKTFENFHDAIDYAKITDAKVGTEKVGMMILDAEGDRVW